MAHAAVGLVRELSVDAEDMVVLRAADGDSRALVVAHLVELACRKLVLRACIKIAQLSKRVQQTFDLIHLICSQEFGLMKINLKRRERLGHVPLVETSVHGLHFEYCLSGQKLKYDLQAVAIH